MRLEAWKWKEIKKKKIFMLVLMKKKTILMLIWNKHWTLMAMQTNSKMMGMWMLTCKLRSSVSVQNHHLRNHPPNPPSKLPRRNRLENLLRQSLKNLRNLRHLRRSRQENNPFPNLQLSLLQLSLNHRGLQAGNQPRKLLMK